MVGGENHVLAMQYNEGKEQPLKRDFERVHMIFNTQLVSYI